MIQQNIKRKKKKEEVHDRRKTSKSRQGSRKEPRLVLGEKQAMEAGTPVRMNRQYQSSLFRTLFKEPKYRRAAYLLMHPEDANVTNEEFQDIELENIFTTDLYNDICFMVRGRLIILMEHQSTLNYNMPVRILLYIAEEYKKLFSMKKYRGILHGTEQIRVPEPEFYMVYTGKGSCPDQLRLSDAFAGGGGNGFLELTVKVYKEENAQGVIGEFIGLVMEVKRAAAAGKTQEEAVKGAIRAYRNGYEISEFFEGREDVFEMLGEALTLEEMLDLRDEANAMVITERVTKQVTSQDIRRGFKMLKSLGTSDQNAAQIIMKEYEMPLDEVLEILQNA